MVVHIVHIALIQLYFKPTSECKKMLMSICQLSFKEETLLLLLNVWGQY